MTERFWNPRSFGALIKKEYFIGLQSQTISKSLDRYWKISVYNIMRICKSAMKALYYQQAIFLAQTYVVW